MKKCFVSLFLLTFTFTMAQQTSSSARLYAIRLKPHQDLKKELIDFAKSKNLKAACVVTCVGSLEQFNLRFANQENGAKQSGHFEIVSMTGTFTDSSSHLHLSVSDSTGRTIGGHLLDQNLLYTTAEIVIAELDELEFDRVKDETYGYQELSIHPRKKRKNQKP